MNKKIRDQIALVDLVAMKKQFTGASYSELVQEHLQKNGDMVGHSHAACLSAFTSDEWLAVSELCKEYVVEKAQDREFWKRDCGVVFEEICNRFTSQMSEKDWAYDVKIVFNAFQAITLNFARIAHERKEFRKFAGIKRDSSSRKKSSAVSWCYTY